MGPVRLRAKSLAGSCGGAQLVEFASQRGKIDGAAPGLKPVALGTVAVDGA
jgi:hypothetical protein